MKTKRLAQETTRMSPNKRMAGVEGKLHVHTAEYDSAIKKDGLLTFNGVDESHRNCEVCTIEFVHLKFKDRQSFPIVTGIRGVLTPGEGY